MSGQVYW